MGPRLGAGPTQVVETSSRATRDRHKKTRRQSVERLDFAPDERDLATEAHRADVQIVDGRHD